MTQQSTLYPKEDLPGLYQQHISRQQHLLEKLSTHLGLGYVLIASGTLSLYFKDDRQVPFRVSPYFKQWLPLTEIPNSYLLLTPGNRPTLLLSQPDDIWHLWPGLDSGDWDAAAAITSAFNIVSIKNRSEVKRHLPISSNGIDGGAYIGPLTCLHSDWEIKRINDDTVLNFFDYHRSCQSPYEIACVYQANLAAAAGHRQAPLLFKQGATEAEVLWGYLSANHITRQDNPYEPIIAHNHHGAILHYHQKSTFLPKEGLHSMLIDAGSAFAGYASDISRTYSYEDNDFTTLIAQFDQLQQQLVGELAVGKTFGELYHRSCQLIAAFMENNQFITVSAEEACDAGLIKTFFPHGLGHLIGLRVHDVGQNLEGEWGKCAKRIEGYAKKGDRTIERGMVFTIEPGFYLIEGNLQQLQGSKQASLVNWNTVEKFKPFGGIRIEDNVVICEGESRATNLTRQAFAEQRQ